MQIIGIFDIFMLAIRSATPPLSPADMPSTSSMMSTVFECFTLKYYGIYGSMNILSLHFKHKNYHKQDQPICFSIQCFVGDKFLYRVCVASTDPFTNFAISLPTAVTSINLTFTGDKSNDKELFPKNASLRDLLPPL